MLKNPNNVVMIVVFLNLISTDATQFSMKKKTKM